MAGTRRNTQIFCPKDLTINVSAGCGNIKSALVGVGLRLNKIIGAGLHPSADQKQVSVCGKKTSRYMHA